MAAEVAERGDGDRDGVAAHDVSADHGRTGDLVFTFAGSDKPIEVPDTLPVEAAAAASGEEPGSQAG